MSVQEERIRQVGMGEGLTHRVPGFALFTSKQEAGGGGGGKIK